MVTPSNKSVLSIKLECHPIYLSTMAGHEIKSDKIYSVVNNITRLLRCSVTTRQQITLLNDECKKNEFVTDEGRTARYKAEFIIELTDAGCLGDYYISLIYEVKEAIEAALSRQGLPRVKNVSFWRRKIDDTKVPTDLLYGIEPLMQNFTNDLRDLRDNFFEKCGKEV